MIMVKADNNSTRIAITFSVFVLISPRSALMMSIAQIKTMPAIKHKPGGLKKTEAISTARAIIPANKVFRIQSMNGDAILMTEGWKGCKNLDKK
jgi:hypothetical protein